MLTPEKLLLDLDALNEDLAIFENRYNLPADSFYRAYCRGEEPADTAWILDWAEWAATCKLLQERLNTLSAA